MRNNDALKLPRSGRANGFIPSSFRAISSYLKIVSSGASTVARSAASVASSIVDRDDDSTTGQVLWAGFDKLDVEEGQSRRVLLLGYRLGFQVWDVEEADNVRDLVSEHEGGPVSFMQMLPNPLLSNNEKDWFFDSRPLLVVCSDNSGGNGSQDGFTTIHSNGQIHSHGKASSLPSVVNFYSLRLQSYVHVMKFRSMVYSVRCSSRVVAISQAAQIHCLDASTLEKSYTIVTNPISLSSPGAVLDIGYGPLAVGPRWLAYSGTPVVDPQIGLVLPKQLPTSGLASNGSLVAHYAKESSKHIAAGIVTLGDMGYKKLSQYCSELNNGSTLQKGDGNGHHVQDEENVGIVIVRDIVSKSVIAQFRAHKSPISALCFDPSGTILVTASNQGHNINVFKIMPGNSGIKSHVHLFQLQRGLTNAVIRDISFSNDGCWIMISSSRGTSHLFAINPHVNSAKFHISNQPVALSAISRIRNGHSGWRGTVTGAAAAATGRFNFISGAIASVFHNSKGGDFSSERNAKLHLLVFAPSGHLVQYALIIPNGEFTNSPCDSSSDSLLVEAVQRWNVCQKQYHKEREFSFDIYTENGNLDMKKIYPEGMIKGRSELDRVKDKVVASSDKHRFYMSEAELQMHQQLIPIWAKPRIYFQSMTGLAEEDDSGGEIQIEKIPTRTIETRLPKKNRTKNGGTDPCSNSVAAANEHEHVEESKLPSANGPCSNSVAAAELMDVNNNYSADEDQLQFDDDDSVNNRGSLKTEAPLKTVNTKQENLRMENHFEGIDDEFDFR